MHRHAFCLTIRSGMENEYDRRHREVWPELLVLLKDCGIRNYSIFRQGQSLFGYMESVNNIDEALIRLDAHPIQRKWYDYMSAILIRDGDKSMTLLDEVFHLD
ncbi:MULTISPECIES: L-rhamnose mutarotase [unclassified Paenibacillus]|uniref:L-rhamnose mutarotase n=1 Tax=unclassified Paenibacillus TaxID=185978 RepID=UPI00363D7FDD